MKKDSLSLFGFLVILTVGLAIVLPQRTLWAEQNSTTDVTIAKDQSKEQPKVVKKAKHKNKKLLKSGNKKEVLDASKKAGQDSSNK